MAQRQVFRQPRRRPAPPAEEDALPRRTTTRELPDVERLLDTIDTLLA